MYVFLAGTYHPIAEDDHTSCGMVIPHGTPWVRDIDPDDVHYGDVEGQARKAPTKAAKAPPRRSTARKG